MHLKDFIYIVIDITIIITCIDDWFKRLMLDRESSFMMGFLKPVIDDINDKENQNSAVFFLRCAPLIASLMVIYLYIIC